MSEPVSAASLLEQLCICRQELLEVRRYLTSKNLKLRINRQLEDIDTIIDDLRQRFALEYLPQTYPQLEKYRSTDAHQLVKIARRAYFMTSSVMEKCHKILSEREDSGVENRFIGLYMHLQGTVFPNDLS